jgi:murein DD-endopeptidase MepM/ murein hydrolase activator NlpD
LYNRQRLEVRASCIEGSRLSKARRLVTSVLLLIQAACSGGRASLREEAIPTTLPADGFDFPLDPGRYGPYVRGVTGPLDVDTRFSVQNPALGDAPKCFQDRREARVPFRELYHAGEDWFRLDAAGQVELGAAAGDPVHAVARGAVYMTQEIASQGWILVLAHQLEDGTSVYSAYWHVNELQVKQGEHVERGQVIGVIHDQGRNAHLHWEIRAFADGSQLFPPDSAGGRGTCNGRAAGVAYTWDDDPNRARPEHWGYFDPVAFIESHRP